MSDFEDDMDVDVPPSYQSIQLSSDNVAAKVPPPYQSIQFSSDNVAAKGKRIMADLPVEAEDKLPWYE